VTEAQDEAVAGEQQGPEEQGTLLPGPERSEFVGLGESAVGVLEDVGDGEVVGESGPDQREGGAGNGDEGGDAGAAGGLGEAVGRKASDGACRHLAQRDAAYD
jgi:hypothetical protein